MALPDKTVFITGAARRLGRDRHLGRPRPVVSIPPALGVAISRLVGLVVGDVVVTAEEVAGLMRNLLVTSSPPAGATALSQWIVENHEGLGRRYSSELARRRDRRRDYGQLRTGS